MEGPSGSSFGIDTILSGGSTGSPGVMNGDFRPHGDGRPADFRSQATPSPCSEIDTVGTAPSSPISVSMEHPEPHLGVAESLPPPPHHLHLGPHPPPPPPSLQPSPPQPPPPQLGSASSGPRTSTSSFLIKDILGDSKPLAACAPYSTSVPSPHHTPKQEGSAAPESFRPKLEQEDGKAKLDKRDDTQGDIKCHGEYGPARPRTAPPRPPLKPGPRRSAASVKGKNRGEICGRSAPLCRGSPVTLATAGLRPVGNEIAFFFPLGRPFLLFFYLTSPFSKK